MQRPAERPVGRSAMTRSEDLVGGAGWSSTAMTVTSGKPTTSAHMRVALISTRASGAFDGVGTTDSPSPVPAPGGPPAIRLHPAQIRSATIGPQPEPDSRATEGFRRALPLCSSVRQPSSGVAEVSMPAQLARWATTSRYSDGTASAPEVPRLHSLASATSWSRNDVRPSSSSAPQALRVGP